MHGRNSIIKDITGWSVLNIHTTNCPHPPTFPSFTKDTIQKEDGILKMCREIGMGSKERL
jgi:hypothetical protein